MPAVPCFMFHSPCLMLMLHAPCPLCHAPWPMFHVPWPFFTTYVSLLCPMLHAPLSRPMFHAPCFMLHVPRAIPHVPWSLRYVSCSTLHDLPFMLLHVSWPMAHGCYSFKISVSQSGPKLIMFYVVACYVLIFF